MTAHDLRRRGIRLTRQRRLILDAMANCHCHVTAEELHRQIAPLHPDISLSTIYRTLERLLELRLIAVTDLGGGRVCYEVLDHTRHHHLICHQCGSTVELDDALIATLRERIAQVTGYIAHIDHLALWGVCPACQQATSPAARPAQHKNKGE